MEDPTTFLAPDLKTPLAYPGTPSGFDGTVALIKKLHGALTKFSLDLVAPVVDEVEGRVVYFVKSSGVQTGEWHGVPGTGRPFDHYGFLMMKIDLEKGVIDEMNVLFQDFLFLKQIGVIPYGLY